MPLQAGDRLNCVSRSDRQTCSKYRRPFGRQSFTFTCDKDCQTLPVTVWEDRKKTKIKLTYKNSPHYNGTPHQKCHYLRLLRSRTHWRDKGVSRIFKVVYSHCCCSSQLFHNVSLWQLTQPRARRLYLGSWMSQRNCAEIIPSCTVTKPPKAGGWAEPVHVLPFTHGSQRSAGNTGSTDQASFKFARIVQLKDIKTHRNTNGEMDRDPESAAQVDWCVGSHCLTW